MAKVNAEQAKRHLAKIREIVAKNPTPIFLMSKEDVVKTLRKTREALWEGKFASHP